jgi:hypothetical protein
MRKELFAVIIVLSVIFLFSSAFNAHVIETEPTEQRGKPVVIWYVIAKWLEPDFLDMIEEYRPDIVLLTIFAEDDVVPYHIWHGEDKVRILVEEIQSRGPEVYFSYSLFSRAPYDEVIVRDINIEENIHLSDFSRYLKESEEDQYHRYFDYYLDQGLDPEDIPKVLRKPVDGYYTPIGHYTVIDPLYEPYNEFLKNVITETLEIIKPDGLAFDHIRFFTFDEGYNQDIRDYILDESGLDVYTYVPTPQFTLNKDGWTDDDKMYYNSRARLISEVTQDIVSGFDYTMFGTTMGMIEPARSNGQYVELQGQAFDTLLLMAYDKNPEEIRRNVKATADVSGTDVILGISKIVGDDNDIINNIDAGLASGAKGIYLLGYDFSDEVHEYLLKARGMI